MSFLIVRVSGVSLLEKDLSDRKEGYREYVRCTNAFFPGPRSAMDKSQSPGAAYLFTRFSA